MLSCKMAQVNKVFLRLMCLYGGALDGWTEFWRMTFCPSFPNQILSWSHRDVNIGLSCFASHGRNNDSGEKKEKYFSHLLFCVILYKCELRMIMKNKRQTKAASESIKQLKMNQNHTKWKAFWNGKGRVTSQKFESENLYCYIAYLAICTKNYRRSEASLSLTFSQGFHIKVKPQGNALTSTFTSPKILYNGFYAKEGLQNKLRVKLNKLVVY